MNVARYPIENPLIARLLILTCLLGGIWGFFVSVRGRGVISAPSTV